IIFSIYIFLLDVFKIRGPQIQRYSILFIYNTDFYQNPLAHHLSATHNDFQCGWRGFSYPHSPFG
ncbi:hypothetical protein, partial [Bacteroides fragilis]|uniref:hypothetical protein n=1 Tax=Bacteroides fragilis TaxID=817 RepID=UPI001C6FEC8A